jgi:hypothetical protein
LSRVKTCRLLGATEGLLSRMVTEKQVPAPVTFGDPPRWRRADVEVFIAGTM